MIQLKVEDFWVNLEIPPYFLLKGEATLDGLKYSFSKLVSVNSVVSASQHHNYFDLTSTFDFMHQFQLIII